MIVLLYGSAGSGKTHTITERIRQDAEQGIPSFLIVPEQHTFLTERNLYAALPPAAQLSVQVTNFKRLADLVFRAHGGLSYHYANRGMKSLLMWLSLRELSPMLNTYRAENGRGPDPSLCDAMLAQADELSAYEVSPAKLERASRKLPAENPLSGKLADLSLIQTVYRSRLSDSYDDDAGLLDRMASLLDEHSFFRGVRVYLDAFTSFTEQEYAVLRRIFRQAERVTVTLGCPAPDAPDPHFAPLCATARKLKALCEDAAPNRTSDLREQFLAGSRRTTAAQLLGLSHFLWKMDEKELPLPQSELGHLFLYQCRNRYAEAEQVAHRITECIRAGYRYRDLVVLVRDTAAWSGILDWTLERAGIPCYLSAKTDLTAKAPVKLLLTALRIRSGNWRREDVLAYLKTGLCGFTERETDCFDQYVTAWDIRGSGFTKGVWNRNPDGYVRDWTPRARKILEEANRLRERMLPPLLTYFTALETAADVAGMCRATRQYLVAMDLENKLERLADRARTFGHTKEAQELDQLYDLLTDVLDQIAEKLPDETFTVEEFSTALRMVLEQTEIGTIPTTADQVQIGSAMTYRGDNPKIAFVLGLCEGEFPAAATDHGLLTEADRKALSELGVELSANRELRAREELYSVWRAMSMPSEQLHLFTSTSDLNGASRLPSFAWNRVRALFPGLEVIRPEALAPADRLQNPALSLEELPTLASDAPARPILRSILQELPDGTARLEALDAPVSNTAEQVSPAVADRVFGRRMSLSQTRIERFIGCHFGYYCTNVLNLREEKTAAFRAADVGSFLHRILEQLLQTLAERGRIHEPIPEAELAEMVDEAVEAYRAELLPDGAWTGRLNHLCARLRRLSMLLLRNLSNEFVHSSFSPSFFELPINRREGSVAPLELRLRDGSTLTLNGVVDRVDLFRRDSTVYVRVVDYKSGSKEFSLSDLDYGLNVQMLLYLFSLCSSEDFRKEVEAEQLLPAGVLYLSGNVPTLSLDRNAEEAAVLSEAEKAISRSGLLLDDADVLHAMNNELSPAYLPGVRQTADGHLNGKSLVAAIGFEDLQKKIEGVLTRIAETMRSGAADATPFRHGNVDPCKYCTVRAVCRRTETAPSPAKPIERSSENGT